MTTRYPNNTNGNTNNGYDWPQFTVQAMFEGGQVPIP